MSVTILGMLSLLVVTPALFTLFYSLFAYRKGNESGDFTARRWVVVRRCGSFAFICWCAYLSFAWVVLNSIGILDFNSAGLPSEITSRVFSVFIGILAILPLACSLTLHLLAFGWVDRRVRKESYSLVSFLRLYLALWVWSGSRLLAILVLVMSQTFFFTYDGKGLGIDILNSIVIFAVTIPAFFYSFRSVVRLFGLAVPLSNPQLRVIADDFGNKLGVTVKRLLRMRTFDVPMANGFATSNGDIHLSDKIIDSFEKEEIEAILAHEAAHLRHIKKLTLVRLCFTFGFALLVLGVFPLAFGKVSDIRYVFFFYMIGGYAVFWLISKEKQYQRKCETEADSIAAGLVGSEIYAKALKRLNSINMLPEKFTRKESKYSTHPGFDERINNIQS